MAQNAPYCVECSLKFTGARLAPVSLALKLQALQEDFSRCFPLKSIARELERQQSGGAWKTHWNKNSVPPIMDASDSQLESAIDRVPGINEGKTTTLNGFVVQYIPVM